MSSFVQSMRGLDCQDKEIGHAQKLVGSIVRRYPFVSQSELESLCLRSVARARDTYRPSRGTFCTWFMNIARNACFSYLCKEVATRSHEAPLRDVLLTNSRSSQESEGRVIVEDKLETLSKALSPLAWQLLTRMRESVPGGFSRKDVIRSLGLTVSSFGRVRKEIRQVCSLLSFLESVE